MSLQKPLNWLSKLRFSKRNSCAMVMQSEASECGLACLTMISQFYGNGITLRELRISMPASMQGMSLQQLIQYADVLGLSSRALKVNLNELHNIALPALLHWELNHFVVLTKVTKRAVFINDPAVGKRKLDWQSVNTAFTGIALELTPNHSFKPSKSAKSLSLFDFAKAALGIKRQLIVLLGLSLLLQIFALASPFYMQSIIDHVVANQNTSLLIVITIGFGLLLIIDTLTQWLRETVMLRFSNQFNLLISGSVFTHLLGLPASYFQSRHLGDIMSRFASLQQVREILTQGLISALIDGLLSILTLILMFIYSPKLTLVVLISVSLYCAARYLLYFPIKQLNQQILQSDAKQQSYFMQSVRAIRTIKLSNKEHATHGKWMSLFVNNLNQRIALGRWHIRFDIINKLLFGLENLTVVFIAVGLVMQQAFSIGMLFAFMSYKSRFIASAANLIDRWIEYKLLSVHLQRLEDIVFSELEKPNSTAAALPMLTQANINKNTNNTSNQGATLIVSNLSFAYKGNQTAVFKQLNLHLCEGEFIAIIGASGCGKTSLLNCLLGLNQACSGSIMLNQQVLSPQTRSLHNIAAVMQDDQLLNGSVLDNISQFAEQLNIQLAIKCAQIACVHEDILAMTMQYQTLIGDMGDSLSGGQKQRIILARALYQQPNLLILDEATSHLDIANEAKVCNQLKALNISIVMVAHRPQTIACAEKIYALSPIGLTEISHSNGNFKPKQTQ